MASEILTPFPAEYIYMKFHEHLVDNIGPLWLHTLFGKYATDKTPTKDSMLYNLICNSLTSIVNMISDEQLEKDGWMHTIADVSIEGAMPYLRAALQETRDSDMNIWS